MKKRMLTSISYPSEPRLIHFLQEQSLADYTYTELGASQSEKPLSYDNDHHFTIIGRGEACWEKARAALSNWEQFPPSWTKIFPDHAPIEVGQNVAVLIRLWGIWWINSSRIVYTIDEPDRFGFAYGTLPGHLEKGEECFWIERDAEGQVTYHIKAFSRPRFWLARLGYPLARWLQRRFVRQSLAIMQNTESRSPAAVSILGLA